MQHYRLDIAKKANAVLNKDRYQISTFRRNQLTLHSLAVVSIALYIVLSVVLELNQTGQARIASYGLYICLGVCGAYTLLKRYMHWRWIYTSLLIFGIILIVSYYYSPTTASIKDSYLYRYWTGAIILILIGNVVDKKKDIDLLLNAVILAGVLSSLNVYRQFGLSNLFAAMSRIGTDIGNQNLIGMYCAFSVILSIYKFVVCKHNNRLIWVLPVIICVPAVMFSGSRKAVITIIIAVIFFILFYSENRDLVKRVIYGFIIIGGLIIVISQVPAFQVIEDRFGELFSFVNAGTSQIQGDLNRIRYINVGLEGFKESPIIGNGFCYSYFILSAYTHNNYIELLLNQGLVGFIAYYSVYLKIIMSGIKFRKSNKKGNALLMMIMVSILVCEFGMVTYYNRYILVLLMICYKLNKLDFKRGEME